MMTIRCGELGIVDCDWVASGETPAQVLDEAIPHLRDDHGLDMPDTETILEGDYTENALLEDTGEGVTVMVRRLREALDIGQRPDPVDPWPSIGRTPQR